jgi:hypothetical protein
VGSVYFPDLRNWLWCTQNLNFLIKKIKSQKKKNQDIFSHFYFFTLLFVYLFSINSFIYLLIYTLISYLPLLPVTPLI